MNFSRFKVGVYVRNLFNAHGLLNADTTQSVYGLPVLVTPIRPQTIGATLSASF